MKFDAVWQTPRAGRSGCGVLVEMPVLEVLHPNVSGPPGNLLISCAVLEEPSANMNPSTGTQMSAEWVSRLVLDSSHHWEDAGVGVMSAERRAIESADGFEGLVAYRVRWRLQEAAPAISRVAAPVAVVANGQVTLSCATPAAQIYYAVDASFPGSANPAATLYACPFPAPPPGAVLRFAAYAPAMFRSAAMTQTF